MRHRNAEEGKWKALGSNQWHAMGKIFGEGMVFQWGLGVMDTPQGRKGSGGNPPEILFNFS